MFFAIGDATFHESQESGPRGGHQALLAEGEASLAAMLLSSFHSGKSMGRKELLKTMTE
jgi:hypothetical protein